MLGWISSGGGANKHFLDTRMNDVILRTSSTVYNVVIGNETNPVNKAALYVCNNALGVKRLPQPGYSVDVNGNARFNSNIDLITNNCSLNMSCTHLTFKKAGLDRLHVDNRGLIKNKLLMTENIKVPKQTLVNVQVYAFYKFDTFIVIHIDDFYETELELNNVVYIRGILFSVANINHLVDSSHIAIELPLYFSEDTLHDLDLSPPNNIIDMEIMREYIEDAKIEEVVISLELQSFTIIDKFISIECEIVDKKYIELLTRNSYVFLKQAKTRLSTIDNILILTDLMILQDQITLIMKSADNTNVVDMTLNVGLPLYVHILDVVSPPSRIESDVLWGYVTYDNIDYLTLRDTILENQINTEQYRTNAIEYITFNNILKVDVKTVFKHPSYGLLVDYHGFTTPYTERGSITYTYIGTPVFVLSATMIDPRTLRYTIQNSFNIFAKLNEFKHQNMLVIDFETELFKIKNMVITSSTAMIDLEKIKGATFATIDPRLFEQRIIYILPVKFATIKIIGASDENCFVSQSLGIGTSVITEKLTVAGTASVNNELKWYDHESENPFSVVYNTNALNFNNALFITRSNVQINYPVTVNGIVTANDFLSVSDKVFKCNIKGTSPEDDLSIIRDIQIKHYEMFDTKHKKKGVIAQDLEDVIPESVYIKEGYIPSLYKQGTMSTPTMVCINHVASIPDGLVPGKQIKVLTPTDDVLHLTLTKVHLKIADNVLELHFDANETLRQIFYVGLQLFVYGHYHIYKIIDKDYLFMTAINAIKALDQKLSQYIHKDKSR